nr:CheR family methyltransferase [Cyclobacterium qasimii]
MMKNKKHDINKKFLRSRYRSFGRWIRSNRSIFLTVPSNSGLAYVIIQHLSPDYKSLMPEILSKRTSLPVHTAEDGMSVEPDNVYLIPRKMNMKIFHSKLHLTQKGISKFLNLPIDIFFQSLAEDFEDKGIAVVLSGTGSDGSRGIREIKEKGGIVIVHDPEHSKFDGMPRSAISTGTVDYILRPQDMPAKIIGYVEHPYIQKKDRNSNQSMVPEDYLSKIILIVKESNGLDFTYYKDTTISRRIERRLSINQIENLKDYLEYLRSSKKEQTTLYNELLIGVTKFFRDPEAFELIESDIIPKVFKNKKAEDEIRIWISACSTGEEAYSIAILFYEYMQENDLHNDIKIFVTDVDKNAIEFASAGIYNSSVIADLTSERLSKFFIPQNDGYRIVDKIREMIVFASHNIIKDPPFNKIDFLTCRNLLIYFQAPLQQKVLSAFNFALNKNAYLFLGSSETIGEMEAYFEVVSHKWKVFKSVRSARLEGNTISRFPGGIVKNVPVKKPIYTLKNSTIDLVNIFTEKILMDNSPITVVVNESYEIVNSYGELNTFLILPNINKIADGFEFNLSKMVPQNLKLTFSIAINKAIKSQEDVIHHNVKYQRTEDTYILVDLRFSPLKRPDLNQKFVVVYFIKKEKSKVIPQEIQSYEKVDQLVLQRIADLENELKHNKENLQASIEELETTNEELQSTNEEMISANEELQSTNEELQSVNEELYTVNTEFQIKNSDLLEMNNDMDNLLANSEVRMIFLDIDLKIRKFTENITDIFNLKKNDHGRPILDITHHLKELNPYQEIQPVLSNHETVEQIVKVKIHGIE